MPDLKTLDPKRPLVLKSAQQVNGHQLASGSPITIVDEPSDKPGELTLDQAELLYQRGATVPADRALPTAVESPEQYAERTTEVDDLGDGKFMIRAPWIDGAEFVGEDELEAKRAEIVKTGADGHRELIESVGPEGAVAVIARLDGFTVEDKGSGNFEITGPGIAEPLKIRGRQNAEDKLAELRTAEAKRTSAEAAPVVAGSAEAPVKNSDQVSDPAAPPPGAPAGDGAVKTG